MAPIVHIITVIMPRHIQSTSLSAQGEQIGKIFMYLYLSYAMVTDIARAPLGRYGIGHNAYNPHMFPGVLKNPKLT